MVGYVKDYIRHYSKNTQPYASIKSQRRKERARQIVKELLLQKRRPEERLKEKKRVSLIHNVVLYEAFFVVGVIISIIGYLIDNWFVIIIGVIAMLLSLPLLEIVLRKRLEEDPERFIVAKADELIKKERRIAKKETAIKKQIDELYNKAIRLMAVEKEVKALRKRANLPEEDVKRVLRITDELLEKLPDEEIERFLRSEDFKLYQRVMKRVKQMGLLDKVSKGRTMGRKQSTVSRAAGIEYKTDIDKIYFEVQRAKDISLIALSTRLNIGKERVEGYAEILDNQGLLDLYYTGLGIPKLRVKEVKKRTIVRGDRIKNLVTFSLILLIVLFGFVIYIKYLR